jgi:hypothetical protein
MKLGILVAVILIAGCTGVNDVSDSKLLSTEIKKGNTWRFLCIRKELAREVYTITNISIDSIWVNRHDSLIFSVTRFDSGSINIFGMDSSTILDSINTKTIICEKYGEKTFCSDSLLLGLFSASEYVTFETINNYVIYRLRENSIKKVIQFDGKTFLAIERLKESWTGINGGLYSSSHSLFADKVGIVFDSTSGSLLYPSTRTTLLKYNDIEFSYSLLK